MAASTSTWLADAAQQRRRMLTILIGGLTIVGLSAIDQRAIFMPWSDAEHPMVDTTPTAFFAQALPGGAGSRGGAPTFASAGAPLRTLAPTPGGPAGLIGNGIDGAPIEFAATSDTAGPSTSGGGDGGGGGGTAASGPGLPSFGAAGAPVATGSVPEASTWAMMILGFGVVGAAIRRGRRRIGVIPA